MGKGTISGLPEEWLEPPWWLGVVLAVVAYVLLKWVIPAVAVTTGLLKPVASTSQASAAYVGALFLALTGLSLILAYRRRRALELETSLATLRAMSRERFAHFAAAAFQSEGYAITHADRRDSGIDFVLTRGAERVLVQYHRWRSDRIEDVVLRELHDRMIGESASGCVYVTAGDYTDDALRYAAGKPLRLIAGRELERMLRRVEYAAGSSEASPA